MIYDISWKTHNPTASDDEVTGEVREAVVRAGHQVGDFVITERNHTEGEGRVEIEAEVDIGSLFEWGNVQFFIEGET